MVDFFYNFSGLTFSMVDFLQGTRKTVPRYMQKMFVGRYKHNIHNAPARCKQKMYPRYKQKMESTDSTDYVVNL
jgi:hypothetical protein